MTEKPFFSKRRLIWLMGFALLLILPFFVFEADKPRKIIKNDTINPYRKPLDKASAFVQKASENYFYREFDQGAENYKKAIAIYETRQDFERVAKTYRSLGDLHLWGRNREQAELNYLKSAEYHHKIENTLGEADVLKEIGEMYRKQEEFHSALKWYQKSLEILDTETPNRVLGSLHEAMGHLYWQDEKIPQAIDSFTQAHKTYNALNYHLGIEHMINVLNRLKKIPDTRHSHAMREEWLKKKTPSLEAE